MAMFLFHGFLLIASLIGFGSWGIGKLLNKNPKVKDAAANGVVSLIARLFRM
jgi:hypothetical protein